MFTKKILLVWFLWLSLLVFWYTQNSGLPLGYDHGSYKHFINLLAENPDTEQIPKYLKHQFEPFSGKFLYSITSFTGKEVFFGWWYLAIFALTSVALFLLGKKKKRYTVGSYLGLALFLFSSVQYMNLWWAFGKQMFAIFFLLLLMRYQNKKMLAFFFIASCIALHRLTGIVALLYFLVSWILSKKRDIRLFSSLLLGVLVAVITYSAFFYEQVFPFLKQIFMNPDKQFFLEKKYGTGFDTLELLYYLTPVLLMTILGYIKMFSQGKVVPLLKRPYVITWVLLFLLVLSRSIAYTRLGSFVDLFLIIAITRSLYTVFDKKWICIFFVAQVVTWGIFVNKWHTPFIDRIEHGIIQDMTRKMPESVHLVTLSWSYMSWITGYTNREIYSTYQWVGQDIWTSLERQNMKNNKEKLCTALWKLPRNVVVYIWARERYKSTENNPCLIQIKRWTQGTRLFLYLR